MENRMTHSAAGLIDRITTLSGDTFNAAVIEGAGPIAMEFISYGCGYCRAVEPLLQQVAETIEGNEQIFRVNIDADPELSEAFEVQGMPTIIMFLEGRAVGRVEGRDSTVSNVMAVVTQPFNITTESP